MLKVLNKRQIITKKVVVELFPVRCRFHFSSGFWLADVPLTLTGYIATCWFGVRPTSPDSPHVRLDVDVKILKYRRFLCLFFKPQGEKWVSNVSNTSWLSNETKHLFSTTTSNKLFSSENRQIENRKIDRKKIDAQLLSLRLSFPVHASQTVSGWLVMCLTCPLWWPDIKQLLEFEEGCQPRYFRACLFVGACWGSRAKFSPRLHSWVFFCCCLAALRLQHVVACEHVS